MLTTFSVADVQVDEASGTAAITIAAQSVSSAVSVDWSTSDHTAATGSDYTAASGTANFDSITTEVIVIVNVTLSNDSLKESGETFYVTLSNPSAGTISDATAVITIVDDDATGRTWAWLGLPVDEGLGQRAWGHTQREGLE